MLRTLLGAQKFRAGMDLYFARHDGRAATVEEFVQCFADISGADVAQFMLWYSQAGTPGVVATGSHDAARKSYRLDLVQTVPASPEQPSKEPMVIPLAIGLVGADGCDLPLELGEGTTPDRAVLTLSKPAQSFVFADIAVPPVLSLNRGFSAPIKLVVNQSADELRFLATRDGDAFTRGRHSRPWPRSCSSRMRRRCVGRHGQNGFKAHGCAGRNSRRQRARDPPSSRSCSLSPAKRTSRARWAGMSIPRRCSSARAGLRARVGGDLGAEILERYRSAGANRALPRGSRQRRAAVAAQYLS